MKCELKKDGLYTYFDVGGKKVMPSAYMSYNPKKEYIDDLKKSGVNTFMFPIYAGDEGINMERGLRPFCDNFFKGYGEYDFSAVEKVLEMIGNDDGIYIIPRVCIEPPIWWQKLNPDEVSRDYKGEPQRECFTSAKWREDMMAALKALIDYFDASKWKDNVIGIHIAAGGTEEWPYQGRYGVQFYDYSEPNRKAYVKWLEEKYSDVGELARAWKTDIESFEEVKFPKPIERAYAKEGFLRDPEEETSVLDFYDFHNEAVADTINYFCREVKEYTNYEKLTGVFYGYVFTLPWNFKGTHALAKVNECPYVDFISTTNIGMQPGEGWFFSSAVHSTQLHGKLWMVEGDIRTHLTRGLDETMPHAVPDNDYYSGKIWVGPPTLELSRSAITKGLARALTANSGIWWFDMWGGWLHDDSLLSIISKMSPLLASQNNRYLKSDVALIIDEKGYKYYEIDRILFRDAIHEIGHSLSHAGIMYDIYLQSDIKNDAFPVDDYKLYIFLGGANPVKEDKLAIEKKLQGGNRTLLWLHAASYYDSELCGFELEKRGNYLPKTAVYKGKSYPKYPLPTLKFKNDNGYVLSRFDDGEEAAVIWRDYGDYANVYSLILAPHSELLREIALLSGAHIYNFSGDCIFAGGEIVAIHAVEEGYRRVNLPASGFKAKNAITGDEITVNDMFIDLKMKQYETVIIKIYK